MPVVLRQDAEMFNVLRLLPSCVFWNWLSLKWVGMMLTYAVVRAIHCPSYTTSSNH
jgi:hypothetical protein